MELQKDNSPLELFNPKLERMKRILLLTYLYATSQVFCQNSYELISDFESGLEKDASGWCEPSLDIRHLSTYESVYSETIREEYNYLKENYGFDTDLIQIEVKKDRKKVLSLLTDKKYTEFYPLSIFNGLDCAKIQYEEILLTNEAFKSHYVEMLAEINILDKDIPAKIDKLNNLIKSYLLLIEHQLVIWDEELLRIKKEKTIREDLFLSIFTEKSSSELYDIQEQYILYSEELLEYIQHNDLYETSGLYDELIKKKSVLNAEEIRADAVNGDGIYVAKIIDRKWGMFQAWDKKPRTLVEPDYDSIGQLGWNDPFIKVWTNGKVGLHGINFSDETDSLLVPCAYDELIIGDVTGYQHEYLGKYCAVRKGNKWGFVNWMNGEVIEPIEMTYYKEIDSFGRVARK